MAAPSPTLTCKQCNYANEPERVYCHNCGAKLDRTLLPKEATAKPPKETPSKVRKRVKKLANPASGFFTNWQQALLNAVMGAVSAALLIQFARPPAGVPPMPTKDDLMNAPELIQGIQDLQLQPTPQTRALPENQINLYLASAVKTKGGTSADSFRFDRAFVNLGKDVIRVTAQESLFGYPVYAGAAYKVAISGGKLVSTNVGGNLGRMPVHPMIMEYCGFAFNQLWGALTRERSLMDAMQSVSVQPGTFTFVTKPRE